ncbi:MAG: hypothetical protein QG553_836 [Patescibacteria group bacterium]|nr:hypothetical protein [Patescibacteria group bacterium]
MTNHYLQRFEAMNPTQQVKAGGLAAMVAFNLGLAAGLAVDVDSHHVTHDYQVEQDYGPDVCPQIDEQVIEEVDTLLADAREREASDMQQTTWYELEDKYDVTIPHDAIDNFETRLFEDGAEVLTQGVTGEVNRYFIEPFDYYQERASELLSAYGLDLVVLDEGQAMDGVNMIGYSSADMESQAAKANLVSLVRQLYQTPVELVSYLGTKTVVVGNIVKADTSGYANTVPFPDTVFIDALAANQRTLLHEMGHVWDAQYCGEYGMYNDPQFAALMPKVIQPADHSLDSENQGGSEDMSEGRIVATTDYALEETIDGGIVENKAEIIAQISNYESYTTLPTVEPYVSQQHRLIMARLYQDAPNLMAYMIEL